MLRDTLIFFHFSGLQDLGEIASSRALAGEKSQFLVLLAEIAGNRYPDRPDRSMNRSLFNKDWFYLVAKFKWSMLARTPSREDSARKGMLNDAAMFLYVALFLVFVCGAVSRFVDIITSVCYLRLVLAALLR